MAYKIIETEAFRLSLNSTFDYINTKFKNPQILNDMLDIIDEASELLKIFPDMYAVFEPAYPLETVIRKFPVKDYFIFYTIDDLLEEVQFLKIIHSSRNIYEVNYISD